MYIVMHHLFHFKSKLSKKEIQVTLFIVDSFVTKIFNFDHLSLNHFHTLLSVIGQKQQINQLYQVSFVLEYYLDICNSFGQFLHMDEAQQVV